MSALRRRPWAGALLALAFAALTAPAAKAASLPGGPASTTASLPGAPALPAASLSGVPVELRFFHTRTGKHVDVVYRRGDSYVPEGLAELESFLRDDRTGDERPFDPKLFDLLHDLALAVKKPDAEFQVISAYRSPVTNDFLRRTRNGVASKSLHMAAQAIDVRIAGIACDVLRNAALALQRGGVGFYPELDFVHVDTGRVRRW